MSRRDIVVDILLGTLLLSVFFSGLALIGLAALFASIGLTWIARRVLPGVALPVGSSLFGIWILISGWRAIREAQKRRWRNAFLFLISAPLIGMAWFTPIRSSLGDSGHPVLWLFPVIIVVAIADDAHMGWLRFYLATSVAVAAVLVNSGLLGNGSLSHRVANCVLAVAVAWWITLVWTRRRAKAPDQPFALPRSGT